MSLHFPHLVPRHPIRTATGVALAAIAAAITAMVAPARSNWTPFAFVVVLLVLARFFGLASGIIGSLVAAAIFATWMYAPVGSLAVGNSDARMNLAWMVLASISLAFLLTAPPGSPDHKHHR